MNAYIRLASGRYVDLANFTKDDVCLDSINVSLNTIKRFTGHYDAFSPLTVAQHTSLTMRVADELEYSDEVWMDCLLHDFAESYTNDLASPMKRVLGPNYREVSDLIEKAVYEALWPCEYELTEEVTKKRHWCDLVSLDIERKCMWVDQGNPPEGAWPDVDNPFDNDKIAEMFHNVKQFEIIDLKNTYLENLPI